MSLCALRASQDEDANFKALSGHMQTLHKLKQELDQSQSDVKVLNAEVVTLRKQVGWPQARQNKV